MRSTICGIEPSFFLYPVSKSTYLSELYQIPLSNAGTSAAFWAATAAVCVAVCSSSGFRMPFTASVGFSAANTLAQSKTKPAAILFSARRFIFKEIKESFTLLVSERQRSVLSTKTCLRFEFPYSPFFADKVARTVPDDGALFKRFLHKIIYFHLFIN